MKTSDLTYLINTAGSPSGFSGTSSVTSSSTFPAAIVDNSLKLDIKNTSGSSAKCSFFCDWRDAPLLTEYLLSANNQVLGGYGLWLGAQFPIPIFNLYCDDVIISPVGANLTATTWPFARLDCSYSPKVFDPTNPAVIREEGLEISGEVITLPAPGLTVSGTPTGDPETVYYPLMRYSVKIMQVTTLPLNNILTCMNTINSTPLTIQLGGGNTKTVNAGFALYEGIGQTKRTITTSGLARWDIAHTWLVSPINFNYVLNPALITGTVNITTPYGITPDIFVMPDQIKFQSTDHAGLLGV